MPAVALAGMLALASPAPLLAAEPQDAGQGGAAAADAAAGEEADGKLSTPPLCGFGTWR